MSEALYPYAVSAAGLLAIPGSCDRRLVARIRRNYPLVAHVEQMIDESNELTDDDDERIDISLLEAVRRIVFAEPLVGADDSFVYGFAYDAICRCTGRPLPCEILPFACDALDGALAELGIPLRITDLLYGGPVFQLPEPGEFPSMGRWTCDQLAAAKESVHRAPLTGLDNATLSCVRQVRDWYAQLKDGECIVGILY